MRTFLLGIVISLSAEVTRADVHVYTFPLEVAQEVPTPTIPPGFNPSGVATISLDVPRNILSWEIMYQGLTGDIVAPGAHIHGPAEPGFTANIMIDLAGGSSPVPLPQPASGMLTGSLTISDGEELILLNHLAYINIHTAMNPTGELRGQIVPEPSTLALLALGGLALIRRR